MPVVLKLVPVYQLSSYPVSGLPVENWGWGGGKESYRKYLLLCS